MDSEDDVLRQRMMETQEGFTSMRTFEIQHLAGYLGFLPGVEFLR